VETALESRRTGIVYCSTEGGRDRERERERERERDRERERIILNNIQHEKDTPQMVTQTNAPKEETFSYKNLESRELLT
jgi:hypothetical protein